MFKRSLFQALGQWAERERSEKEQASSSAAFKKICCDLSTLDCCSSATFEKICCNLSTLDCCSSAAFEKIAVIYQRCLLFKRYV